MKRFTAAGLATMLLATPAVAEADRKPISMVPPLPVASPNTVSPSRSVNPKDIQKAAARTYPQTHYQKAMYFKQRGDLNNALVEFLKATQENPRQTSAFYEQAMIFRQRGYLKLAESSLEQALAVQPSYQQARLLLAAIRLEQGKVTDAMQELSRTLGLTGDKQEAQPQSPPSVAQDAPTAVPSQASPDSYAEPFAPAEPPAVATSLPPPSSRKPDHASSSDKPAPGAADLAPGSMHIEMADSPASREASISDIENSEIDQILKRIPVAPEVASAGSGATSNSSTTDVAPRAVAPGTPTVGSPGLVPTVSAPVAEEKHGFRHSFSWLNPSKLRPPAVKFPEFKLPEMRLPEMKVPDIKFPHVGQKASPSRKPAKHQPPKPKTPGQKTAKPKPPSLKSANTTKGAKRLPKPELPKLPKAKESPIPRPEKPKQEEKESWFARIFGGPKRLPPPTPVTDLQQEYAKPVEADSPARTARAHFPSMKELQQMSMVIHQQPQPTQQPASTEQPAGQAQVAETKPETDVPNTSELTELSPLQPAPRPLPRIEVAPPPPPRPGISITFNPIAQFFSPPKPSPSPTRPQRPAAPSPQPGARPQPPAAVQPSAQPLSFPGATAPQPVAPATRNGDRTHQTVPPVANLHPATVAAAPSLVPGYRQPPTPAPAPAPSRLSEPDPPPAQDDYADPPGPPPPANPTLTSQTAKLADPPIQPSIPNPVLTKQTAKLAGPPFSAPQMPTSQMSVIKKAAEQPKPPAPSAPAQPEDQWTKRMKYLAAHGTSTLKPGEAFMFSEETGEAVMFLQNGETVRRMIAAPRDREEVVKERRPELLIPQDLMYNLSLLGKLIPHSDPKPPSQPLGGNFPSVEQLLQQQDGFWGWLKQRFRLPGT